MAMLWNFYWNWPQNKLHFLKILDFSWEKRFTFKRIFTVDEHIRLSPHILIIHIYHNDFSDHISIYYIHKYYTIIYILYHNLDIRLLYSNRAASLAPLTYFQHMTRLFFFTAACHHNGLILPSNMTWNLSLLFWTAPNSSADGNSSRYIDWHTPYLVSSYKWHHLYVMLFTIRVYTNLCTILSSIFWKTSGQQETDSYFHSIASFFAKKYIEPNFL